MYLTRVNSTINDRIIVANYVVINDLAIIEDARGLVAHCTESGAILGREVASWRPAVVCGAEAESKAYPNSAASPS